MGNDFKPKFAKYIGENEADQGDLLYVHRIEIDQAYRGIIHINICNLFIL